MQYLIYIFFTLSVLAAGTACRQGQEPRTAAEQLDAYFRAEFPADEPSAAVLVVQDGQIVLEKATAWPTWSRKLR